MEKKTPLKTVVFCAIMQQVVVISYQRSGTTYQSHLKGSRIQEGSHCLKTKNRGGGA